MWGYNGLEAPINQEHKGLLCQSAHTVTRCTPWAKSTWAL
jgi:hypothetical protein